MKNIAKYADNPARISGALIFKGKRYNLEGSIVELVAAGRYRHPAAARRHLTMKLGCEKLAMKLAKRSIRRGARTQIAQALADMDAA